MTLFVILICAAVAYAAYRYNTRYIEAEAQEKEEQSVFTIGNEERQAWASRLVAEIEAAKAEREAPIRNRKERRLEFVISEAESKIEREHEEITQLQKKRETLNKKLEESNTSIQFYQLSGNVDKEIAEQSKKEKLEEQIFNLSKNIRNHKERMNKAYFTRQQAREELEEIA